MTDTRPETILTPPPPITARERAPRPRPPRGGQWWAIPLVTVSFVVLGLIVLTALLPAELVAHRDVADPERDGETVREATPYAMVPAAAQPVAARVSYDDLDAGIVVDADRDGRVFFVTISEPAQSVLGWWVGSGEPAIEFLTHEQKFGSQTPAQRRTVSLQQMNTSSQVAQYVALTLAGYDAELVPGPVQIEQMLCVEVEGNRCARYVDNAEQLDEGDTVVAVDGTPIDTIDDLTAALADNEPGDTVSITVERVDVGETTVEVELMASPNEPGRAIIGFQPFDTTQIELPFEIDFSTGEIGGPSAGLAFTLTLLDELTEGDLLGGVDVAVTGTIHVDGAVGPIGGLTQKVAAVRQSGIDYFLVPAGQSDAVMEEAQRIAGDDLELIPVGSIDEALAALERLGGDPLPERPSGD